MLTLNISLFNLQNLHNNFTSKGNSLIGCEKYAHPMACPYL